MARHLAAFRSAVGLGLTSVFVCLSQPSAQVLAPGLAQSPPKGTGLVLGRVVDGTSGAPIANARVICSVGPPWLVTDDEGRFVFFDLPPGNYQFSVTKPGYMKGELGQRWASSTLPIEVPPFVPYLRGQALTLGAGERRSDITIRLWKEGAITGRVVDEFGEPVVGILVQAWAERFQAGRAMLESALPVIGRTDDRGVYRMIEVPPGRYAVVIAQPLVTTPANAPTLPRRSDPFLGPDLLTIGPMYRIRPLAGSAGAVKVGDWLQWISAAVGPASPSDGGQDFSYPTIFYANAASATDASPVTVPPGDDASGVDFQLARERMYRVSGRVTGPHGATPNVTLRLIGTVAGSSGFPTARTATAISDAQGAFMFSAAPPGNYVVEVNEVPRTDGAEGWQPSNVSDFVALTDFPAVLSLDAQTLWASVPVAVGGDVRDLDISLRPGMRLTGRVQFVGATPPPSAAMLAKTAILIDRVDGGIPTMRPYREVEISPTGEFHSVGLPPGKYFVRVTQPPGGWMLQSVDAGGRDISNVPLELSDQSVGGIVIRFADRANAVSGLVRTKDGLPDSTASVALFPSDPKRWIDYGSQPRDIVTARVSANGTYEIRGLPSGDYWIVAVDDVVLAEWHSPHLFDALSRVAEHVRNADTDVRVIDLVTKAVGK